MKPLVLWLSIFAGLVLQAPASAWAQAEPELTLLEVSELDAEDTAHLRELLDRPVRVVRLPVSEQDPVRYARRLGAVEVLVLDRAHERVSLVLEGDPEVLERATGSAVSRSSYAVSFVASELLTTAAQLEAERAERWSLTQVWFRGSVDVLWASEPYTGVFRPSVAMGGLWARPLLSRGRSRIPPRHSLGVALEFGLAVAGHAERARGYGEIEFKRQDYDVRCGPAYRLGALQLFGFGQLGVAIRDAHYTGPGGNDEQLFSGTFGVGVQLQVAVFSWLSLLAEASSGVFAHRAEFSLQGERVLREGALTGRAGLGLAFVLPVR
jgi:hypothetical protein